MSWGILLVGLALVMPAAARATSAVLAARPWWGARVAPVRGPADVARVAGLVAAWLGLLFVVFAALGFGARGLESWVDHPVYDAFVGWRTPSLTPAMDALTQIGDQPAIQLTTAVSAAALALLWRRRRWLPALVVVGVFLAERYLQTSLAHLVDRGHPPGEPGTWPSGGCARLISVYGTVLLLAVAGARQRRREPVPAPVGTALWTLLAVAAWLEAFSRVYLGKHWLTDVVGGVAFGVLLLAVPGFVLLARAPQAAPEPAQLSRS